MKTLIKKISAVVMLSTLASLACIATVEKPADAQVVYCSNCCDVNPYTGGARIRCGLVNPWPCGGACVCAGVAGSGFACY